MRTKELTLKGVQYRVGKLDPMTAGWVARTLGHAALMGDLGKNTPTDDTATSDLKDPMAEMSPEERGATIVGMLWLTAGSTLPEDTYRRIQMHCLKASGIFNSAANIYESVIMADGRFTHDTMKDDATLTDSLVLETLKFSLSVFFQGDAAMQPSAK